MRFRLWFVSTLGFVLSACSGSSSFHVAVAPSSKSVVATDSSLSKVIKPINPKSSAIRLGNFFVDENDAKLENDESGQITFTGRITLKNTAGAVVHSRMVSLHGVWLEGVDHPVLESEDEREGEPQVKARLTCLSSNIGSAGCGEVLIDLFMKVPGFEEIQAAQLQTVVTGHKISPPKADKNVSESEDDFVAPVPEAEESEEKDQPEQKQEPVKTPEVVKPTPPKGTSAPPLVSKPVVTTPSPKPVVVKPVPMPAPAPEKKKEVPPPLKKEEELPADNDVDDQEGVDSTEKPSIYVGTIFQGADDLFKPHVQAAPPARPKDLPKVTPTPAPVPTPEKEPKKEEPQTQTLPVPRPKPVVAPPKPPEKKETPAPAPVPTPEKAMRTRPKDQAVGRTDAGTLENANSLREMNGSFVLLAPSRERYYGTYELVRMINALSTFMISQKLGPLGVGDLSQEEGGKLKNSKHRSHQNGLDADMAYPVDVSLQNKGFVPLVSGGRVDSRLRVYDTWRLFKYIWSFNELEANRTTKMDRIFLDENIKEALCSVAAKDLRGPKGGSFTELLRRLRPTPGHYNHFHLRVQCSPFQPRCRMMGDPPAGSGC